MGAEKELAVGRLLAAWERLTRVSRARLRSQSRERSIARARWAVMVALRQLGLSLPEIGAALGGRHHTTILHGIRSARAQEYQAAASLLREAGFEPVVEVAA